jgi:hypothetical protein
VRKHAVVFLVAVAVFIMEASLSGAAEKLPPPQAKAFWTYISQTNPYTKWQTWPGYPGLYPGKSPHGKYLKLYANEAAIQAAKEGKDMPDGAILVKENYTADKRLVAITPMYRVKGYNPAAGDWFWGEYRPNGKVMAAGKIQSCIKCHRTANHDWRFTTPKFGKSE